MNTPIHLLKKIESSKSRSRTRSKTGILSLTRSKLHSSYYASWSEAYSVPFDCSWSDSYSKGNSWTGSYSRAKYKNETYLSSYQWSRKKILHKIKKTLM